MQQTTSLRNGNKPTLFPHVHRYSLCGVTMRQLTLSLTQLESGNERQLDVFNNCSSFYDIRIDETLTLEQVLGVLAFSVAFYTYLLIT